ncbi:major facilitator superfamily domain-containing protein 6-like [Portunus trituberculatus]|uniref:major facilitator superfamily domain-containing protein 6-like n=1 Tax=Portunus trituberculatus TaxID=210409 RepID=UPI001E1CE546|nr:major facilitator superfamily domain-containing protein 6-like [Portunus trituberculatus]
MKINKNLLPIKVHYFLRYAGAAPLATLFPLIVRNKGVSPQTVGLLWTIFPIVGLITKCICGTLADYLRAYRTVFLSSIISLTAGLLAMYWIPELPIVAQTSEEAFNITLLGNATFYSSAFLVNSSTLSVELGSMDPEMTVGESQQAPLALPPGEETTGILEESEDVTSLLRYPQFWFIIFALMLEQTGIYTCIMITDSVCFQILGSERHLYGRQRLWGTIGMGVMAIVSGALVDIYSQGLPQKDYLPAVISCIVLMSADILVVARMKIPYSSDDKLKMGEVGNILVHPEVLLFLMTVYVMGASLGIVWIFKLMLVDDITLAWNPDFPALKLLQGLVLGIEAFGGEVPFFFLSGVIIQWLGYTGVLITSVLSTGLRCCLYYTVSNPWYFLPIELLNGLSYSVFHSVMGAYASHISPPGALATVQSVFRSTFYIGVSTAGLLGGLLYNTKGGSIAFLVVGVFDLIYVLVFVLLHILINKYCSSDEASSEVLQDCCKQNDPTKEMPNVVGLGEHEGINNKCVSSL